MFSLIIIISSNNIFFLVIIENEFQYTYVIWEERVHHEKKTIFSTYYSNHGH